jgi:Capsule assembly protein Wzi
LSPGRAKSVFAGSVALAALVLPGWPRAAADDPAEPAPASPVDATPVDNWVRRSTEFAVIAAPDGLVLAAGGPAVDTPWILSPPVRGSGGFQGLLTLHDQAGWRVRLGAGWANVRTTRTAPPFQEGPSRHWNFDGSEIAWRHDGGEWYASAQRRNWGPGWTGSLILDGAAPPLAAVGWRRAQPLSSASPWLSWMGPWTADVFVGRLAGHDEPERPALIGFRLQMQPFDKLQLGLARTLQWGGRGRDENVEMLLRGLLGRDNVGYDGITDENQPGNQLGGFDWRLQLGAEPGSAFYGQLVGEDENGYLPSAYIVQAGFEARWALQDAVLRGFVEWNDLVAGHAYDTDRPPGITYTSTAYRRGYTHDRVPLGHPAGGDVTLASAGLSVQAAAWRIAAVASRGEALPTSQRFAAGPISGLNGSAQLGIDARNQVGAGLWWWRDSADEQRALQLWWRVRF